MQQACNSDAIDSEAQPEPEAGCEIDSETQATLDKCAVQSSNSAFEISRDSSQILNFFLERPQSSERGPGFVFAARPSTKTFPRKDVPVSQPSIRPDIPISSVELAENSALQQGMRINEF